jgi:hypothetical protein
MDSIQNQAVLPQDNASREANRTLALDETFGSAQ